MAPPSPSRLLRPARVLAALAVATLLGLAAAVYARGPLAFVLGGALIDLGYRGLPRLQPPPAEHRSGRSVPRRAASRCPRGTLHEPCHLRSDAP